MMVGDPVFHAEKHHWGLGIVQSISDEVNSVTCGWWSDVGYFQAGSPPDRLIHASLSDRIASTAGPSSDVVEALRTCREQFAFYVTSHKTKGTDDGNVKAAINQNFVDMCDKALASTAGDTLKAESERLRTALGELAAACDGEVSEVFAGEIGAELDLARTALEAGSSEQTDNIVQVRGE